jgi:hypothetical protein
VQALRAFCFVRPDACASPYAGRSGPLAGLPARCLRQPLRGPQRAAWRSVRTLAPSEVSANFPFAKCAHTYAENEVSAHYTEVPALASILWGYTQDPQQPAECRIEMAKNENRRREPRRARDLAPNTARLLRRRSSETRSRRKLGSAGRRAFLLLASTSASSFSGARTSRRQARLPAVVSQTTNPPKILSNRARRESNWQK